MKRSVICLLFFMGVFSSLAQVKKVLIPIKWVSNIDTDFSFTNEFSYPDGIIKNEYGELICGNDCATVLDAMKDSTGRIIPDSLFAYYNIVDTSHQFHSIESNAWCYEWAGTHFTEAYQLSTDTVFCFSLKNTSTHCSLELKLVGDQCLASINLKSIVKGKSAVFECKKGFINIDKIAWDQGYIKATFDFNFDHQNDPNQPMFWRGEIFTKIKSDNNQH